MLDRTVWILIAAVPIAIVASVLGWPVIIVGIIAAMVLAWAAGVVNMAEEEQGSSDERPEYDRD